MVRRIVSLVVLIALVVADFISPAQAAALTAPFLPSQDILKNHLAALTPSEDLGQIVDAHWSEKSGSPLIVQIQDLHADYETQTKIKALLEFYRSRIPGLNHVAVEGAEGPLWITQLAKLPDPALKSRICDRLMQSAELTGMEAYAIVSGKTDLLVGAEDERYHQANIDLFRKTFYGKEALAETLKRLRADLAVGQRQLYNGPMQRLAAKAQRFQEGHLDNEIYLRGLARQASQAGIDVTHQYPEIARQLTLQDGEQFPNLDRLMTEQFALLTDVEVALARTDVQRGAALMTHDLDLLQRLATESVTTEEVRYLAPRLPQITSRLKYMLESIHQPFNAEDLSQLISASLDFYAMALLRDPFLANKTLALRESTVLVAGGFHTPGVTKIFRDQGASYIVIRPTLTHAPSNRTLYDERLLGHHASSRSFQPQHTVAFAANASERVGVANLFGALWAAERGADAARQDAAGLPSPVGPAFIAGTRRNLIPPSHHLVEVSVPQSIAARLELPTTVRVAVAEDHPASILTALKSLVPELGGLKLAVIPNPEAGGTPWVVSVVMGGGAPTPAEERWKSLELVAGLYAEEQRLVNERIDNDGYRKEKRHAPDYPDHGRVYLARQIAHVRAEIIKVSASLGLQWEPGHYDEFLRTLTAGVRMRDIAARLDTANKDHQSAKQIRTDAEQAVVAAKQSEVDEKTLAALEEQLKGARTGEESATRRVKELEDLYYQRKSRLPRPAYHTIDVPAAITMAQHVADTPAPKTRKPARTKAAYQHPIVELIAQSMGVSPSVVASQLIAGGLSRAELEQETFSVSNFIDAISASYRLFDSQADGYGEKADPLWGHLYFVSSRDGERVSFGLRVSRKDAASPWVITETPSYGRQSEGDPSPGSRFIRALKEADTASVIPMAAPKADAEDNVRTSAETPGSLTRADFKLPAFEIKDDEILHQRVLANDMLLALHEMEMKLAKEVAQQVQRDDEKKNELRRLGKSAWEGDSSDLTRLKKQQQRFQNEVLTLARTLGLADDKGVTDSTWVDLQLGAQYRNQYNLVENLRRNLAAAQVDLASLRADLEKAGQEKLTGAAIDRIARLEALAEHRVFVYNTALKMESAKLDDAVRKASFWQRHLTIEDFHRGVQLIEQGLPSAAGHVFVSPSILAAPAVRGMAALTGVSAGVIAAQFISRGDLSPEQLAQASIPYYPVADVLYSLNPADVQSSNNDYRYRIPQDYIFAYTGEKRASSAVKLLRDNGNEKSTRWVLYSLQDPDVLVRSNPLPYDLHQLVFWGPYKEDTVDFSNFAPAVSQKSVANPPIVEMTGTHAPSMLLAVLRFLIPGKTIQEYQQYAHWESRVLAIAGTSFLLLAAAVTAVFGTPLALTLSAAVVLTGLSGAAWGFLHRLGTLLPSEQGPVEAAGKAVAKTSAFKALLGSLWTTSYAGLMAFFLTQIIHSGHGSTQIVAGILWITFAVIVTGVVGLLHQDVDRRWFAAYGHGVSPDVLDGLSGIGGVQGGRLDPSDAALQALTANGADSRQLAILRQVLSAA